MPRKHGYSPRGKRCFGKSNWHEKGRIHVIGALGKGFTLLTAALFNCTIKTEVFISWLKEDLLPKIGNGSVLVLDNAAFHNRKQMREAIGERDIEVCFLPPYSPDLNKIERKWAQAKAIRRRSGCDVESLFCEYSL